MSTDPPPFRFPAPIGGFPISGDLAPSILFVCLYASLVGVAVLRIRNPQSRNVVMYAAVGYLSERVILWSLRAWTSQTPAEARNRHIVTYFQVGFNAGYLAIWGKLAFLLRTVVVNSTKGTSPDSAGTPMEELPRQSDIESPALPSSAGPSDSKLKIVQTEELVIAVQEPQKMYVEDQPRRRALYRKVLNIITPAMLLPFIIGAVMGNWYPDAETSASKAKTVEALRYIVAVLALMLVISAQTIAIFALFVSRRVRRGPILLLLLIASIIMIIPIYQLVIMRDQTTSLLSHSRGSQNTPEEKVFFYVLQVVPEFTCVCALLSINTKRMFGTDMWGDHADDVSRLRRRFARR
ncbi:hypothetical protein PHLGIDRAFT_128189 [Phlebiopsis gigantea 11061_1 CR5-6]|uniref:Uncharacterized protein n=1 Tax=Phlebiopsis gigantea (strain 11061_1 CR5-6) TaxID=745531 RepID=A0A0C3S9Z5_PHLG1|nr:hypothetical protein PHLGIDRAFT_128189 [Phlebiopsis gigantea 11061_1 CR5-6]